MVRIQKTTYADLLAEFLRDNVGPVQRSKEWYALRKTSVGGSEVPAILGNNPYCSPETLLVEKTSKPKVITGSACAWGTVLEPYTMEWARLLTGTDAIYDSGSLTGFVPGQRYSPDGLGVVEFTTKYGSSEEITLFEFKSPLTRLNDARKIPAYYVDQVNAGLASITVCNIAVFISNVFRISSLKTLADYRNIHHFHSWRGQTKIPSNTILGMGIVYFHNDTDECIDLGSPETSKADIDGVFTDFSDGKLKVTYSPFKKCAQMNHDAFKREVTTCPDPYTAAKELASFHKEYIRENNVYAFLPIKLYDSLVVIHRLNPKWVPYAAKKITEFVEQLHEAIDSNE